VFVRPAVEHENVSALAREGLTSSAISRLTGIPRTTVRSWLGLGSTQQERRTQRRRRWAPNWTDLPAAEYAYLLGLYLGDGHVVAVGRTFRLCLSLDGAYPGIVAAAAETLAAIVPANNVAVRTRSVSRCVDVSCYWLEWPRLLPQHGPGRKHTRPIALAGWQEEITHRHPEAMLRGLIHSDGCRFVAVVRKNGREYSYVRYDFSNRSDDIKSIFCDHLDLMGVRWRRIGNKSISVARMADVAVLDRFIGPKR
jgi:hypothetical protein